MINLYYLNMNIYIHIYIYIYVRTRTRTHTHIFKERDKGEKYFHQLDKFNYLHIETKVMKKVRKCIVINLSN